MNFIPSRSSVWVGDTNSEYTVQDYVGQSTKDTMFSYFLYVLLWMGSWHLLNLFNTQYDRTAIFSAFLIGFVMIIMLDYVNSMTWELAINKADKYYYVINNEGPVKPNYRIMKKNSIFRTCLLPSTKESFSLGRTR